MSGEQGLLEVEKKKSAVEHWDSILDEYEKSVGMPPFMAPGDETELQGYL